MCFFSLLSSFILHFFDFLLLFSIYFFLYILTPVVFPSISCSKFPSIHLFFPFLLASSPILSLSLYVTFLLHHFCLLFLLCPHLFSFHLSTSFLIISFLPLYLPPTSFHSLSFRLSFLFLPLYILCIIFLKANYFLSLLPSSSTSFSFTNHLMVSSVLDNSLGFIKVPPWGATRPPLTSLKERNRDK